MAPIRHWSGLRLAAIWMAAIVVCGVVWRVLGSGVVEGRIIDLEVAEVTGHWSSSFASGAMTLFATVTIVILAVTTLVWVRGREERVKRRLANDSADNRILIGPPRPELKKGLFQR